MNAAQVDQETFRKACARFATGIAIATVTAHDGTPCGLTINSFTSVSASPPLVLICVDYRCAILQHFRTSSYFGVNILREGQRELSVRFAERQFDRFEGIRWHRTSSGVPLLEGVLATLECSVTQVVEAGDHAVFIAEVLNARWDNGNPLLYFRSSYAHLSGATPAG